MTRKKAGYYILASFILIIALAGITSFFMYSDIIGRSVQSVLSLETDPSYTGGRIADVFSDPVGDDHGYGKLAYPKHADFAPGSLDLVRYVVHEPVFNAQWTDLHEFWQIDLVFSAPSENTRNIRIYIDADGDGKGSTETKITNAENIEFDPSFPWDYVLSVQNHSGTIRSSDCSLVLPLRVTESNDKKEMTIRIPLQNRVLQSLYAVSKTRQYVCIGGWQPWGRDGFVDTSDSSFVPKLYDIIVPAGMKQEQILSAWDDDSFVVPVMHPIVVRMHPDKNVGKGGKLSAETVARYDELKKAAASEEEKKTRDANALYESAPSDPESYAIAAFNAGKRSEAEAMFDRILAKAPESPSALAYKGSLVAMRGGDASPLAAVGIIAEAYRYLDRAVSLASTTDDKITVFINRASVSMSVPDLVFAKALQGAEDFLAAAEEMKKLSVSGAEGSESSGISNRYAAAVATDYCNAAKCYEIAGKADEAETWYREARLFIADAAPGTGSAARLEIFRHFEIGSENDISAKASENPESAE